MPDEAPADLPQPPKKLTEEAEERSAPAPAVVYEAIYGEGRDELKRGSSSLFFSGLAAGLSMGFSLISEGLLRAYLPDVPWRPLVAKLGYSVGFLIVVLGRQQLFTENTLTAVVPLLANRTGGMLRNVARLWGVVLLANLVGALAFAFVLGRTELFKPEVHHAFVDIAHKAVENGFWLTLLKGVFAGWLIALLVWMLPASESSHVLVIVLVTWLVGVGEFAHIVAGAVEVFYLAVVSQLGWGETFTRFIIPTLIGNVLGGVTLVSALNHAQVTAGGGKSHG
jgi:formate/nitrite transporter FocA (FNT family)